jgi:hypothetical protein
MEHVTMNVIMIVYYVISAFLVVMLAWNFVREKKSVNDMILYLLVIIPLVLRILRVK